MSTDETPPPWAHYRATNQYGQDIWIGKPDQVGGARAEPVGVPATYMFADIHKCTNVVHLNKS